MGNSGVLFGVFFISRFYALGETNNHVAVALRKPGPLRSSATCPTIPFKAVGRWKILKTPRL